MSEADKDTTEVLLEKVITAQGAILDIVSDLPPDGSAEASGIWLDYLDDISDKADSAGYAELKIIARDLRTHLGAQTNGLTSDMLTDIVSWFGDVLLHMESPDDLDIKKSLLKPLSSDIFGETPMDTGRFTDAEEVSSGEVDGESDSSISPDFEGIGAQVTEAGNFDIVFPAAEVLGDENLFSDMNIDGTDTLMCDVNEPDKFDTDSILGMLASELHDVSPQLRELALSVASKEAPEMLIEAVGAYQELVYRMSSASESVGLKGLVLVCDFVANNALLVAELTLAERADTCEVLQGWPQVVINHLVNPKDDGLCLAVVDYLEKEDWPQPLAYSDQHELIEGLTSELKLSGDYEVEVRATEAKPEDVELETAEDASPKLIEAFLAESPGHAETFSALVEAIASGQDIQNNVEAAQRIAHTLKGSGNLVGAKGIANLCHHIEDIFEYIAKHQIIPPGALALSMQEAADTIEIMLEYIQGIAPPPDEAQRVLQDVIDWANRIDSGNLRQGDFAGDAEALSPDSVSDKIDELVQLPDDSANNYRISDAPGRENSETGRRSTDVQNIPAQGVAEAVRVPTGVLDNIFRIVGETAIAIGQIQDHLNRLEDGNKLVRKNDISLQQRRYELENLVSVRGMAARHRSAAAGGSDNNFDPLEMDEYDEFYGVTHSYIEGVADSRQILRGITSEVSDLSALFLLQQRLNKELQQLVMTTRMVPVGSITARLQRTVRQVCRATGKQAKLTIIGEDLQLDGDVLNKLADPLMHMLRNAVDHSIETGSDRFDKGMTEVGNITLSFLQEGSSVVVICADDGSGLNYERIREIAVKSGLISRHEAVGNAALARMILQSGFTTSDQVTQISGRGVGMDVVFSTIQSLNGSMDIAEAVGGGTQISLRLPITLLTSHCLMAGAGKDTVYAIPTSSLAQILSPGTGQIGNVGGNLTFQLGQDVYPVHSLNSLMGFSSDEESLVGENTTVLLLQAAQGMTAITVDRVVSSHDLVVKNMGAYVKDVRGVAGVSTLGDGGVVAVLDLASLLQDIDTAGVRSKSVSVNPESNIAQLSKVLVVDDSLSVRSTLSLLMKDGGYDALTARDGVEAVDLLDKEQPDIVLTDLEMPRMNGLELTSYIRNSERWKSLPVVMITSRTMLKHRQQAKELGVNHYITKPFSEDEVLASIGEHLQQSESG